MDHRIELLLPPDPEVIHTVRRAIDALEVDVPIEVVDNVRLLTSELLSNCIRHANLAPSERIDLKVTVADGVIRVEVADTGAGFDPPSATGDGETSGWGLMLVDSLSDRWGVGSDPSTTVWFEIRAN